MGFVDERRKVIITLTDGVWEFKALDGSVLSKPEGADESLRRHWPKLQNSRSSFPESTARRSLLTERTTISRSKDFSI